MRSGGAERATTILANRWTDKGRRVTIVTLDAVESDFYKLRPAVRRIDLESGKRQRQSVSLTSGQASRGRDFQVLSR